MPALAFNSERLRQWRLESGLRVEEVAARSGISYSYLRALEDRGGNPTAGVLAALADVYGRPVGELLTLPSPT
jgi:transcriptional regulator with XRE-family HTH domain